MIASEHLALTLSDFSAEWGDVRFAHRDLRKPLDALTQSDLLWCLQMRCYLTQVLDLVLDQIAAHWSYIDRYYLTEISAWYEEVIKAVVTIPYTFWDACHATHEAISDYIRRSDKWEMAIEKTVIDAFLAYVPQPVCWTRADSDDFESDLSYGLAMGILGNLIRASQSITRLKTAILHHQPVWIESAWQSITTETELMAFVEEEYADFGEDLDSIKKDLQKHRRIRMLPAT